MNGNSKKKSLKAKLLENQRLMDLYLSIDIPSFYRSGPMDAIFSEWCPIVNKNNDAKIMEMDLEDYKKKKLLELCRKWEANQPSGKKRKSRKASVRVKLKPKQPNTQPKNTKRRQLAKEKREKSRKKASRAAGNSNEKGNNTN